MFAFEHSFLVFLPLALLSVGVAGRSSILPELVKALPAKDVKAIERDAAKIEEVLFPIYRSMPHNRRGKMGSPVVRYLLHRFFMKAGWSVRGLEPDGQGWSTGSPTDMLGERFPKKAKELFDGKINGEGMNLADVSLLAAAFKSLVRAEEFERLEAIIGFFQKLDTGKTVSSVLVERILEAYTAVHLYGKNISRMTAHEVREVEVNARDEYLNFPQLLDLVRNLKQDIIGDGDATFADMARVAEKLGKVFGPAEDRSECQPRKRELVELEHRSSGRVPIAAFYKAALHDGKWHFGESLAYLRHAGALDETNPENPQVIIANYMNGRSNCVDASGYYSVCCLNECDALLEGIEQQIGFFSATPSQLAPIVAAMPSSTVPANRELPKSLLRRLEEIAAGSNGRVHLHGRLFLQWMHHAYPRECPFPHVSGTVNTSSMSDWFTTEPDKPVAAAATEEEMREHIEKWQGQHSRNATSNGTDGESGDCAPWYGHEELLVPLVHEEPAAPQVTPPPSLRAVQSTSSPRSLWIASAVMALMALTTGVVGVVRLMQTPKKADEKLIDLDVVHYV